MHSLLLFVLGVFVLAIFLRVDFLFYIIYLFFGLYFLAQVWVRRGLQQIVHKRHYVTRAFLGERITVTVEVVNNGILPLPWLRINETLPIELHSPAFFRRIVSLLPNERVNLSYELHGRRRGYYRIGPLYLGAGDPFGVSETEMVEPDDVTDYLVVYPKIVPLQDLGLPSHMPYGTLPSKQRIFEDPTRIMGVRDYQAGDSLKRINWKTSASTGKLQVKRYQPAISLETAIFLNLNGAEYSSKNRREATELAIIIAASMAVNLVENRQAVGLSTNGRDPLAREESGASQSPHVRGENI